MREAGYYKVKVINGGEFEMHYCAIRCNWHLDGCGYVYYDFDLKIDENQIITK